MTDVRDFVAALAMARKRMNEIKIPTDQVYDNKSLKKTEAYQFIKEVKRLKKQQSSGISTQNKIRLTKDIGASVAAAAVEEDRL
jgi:hypothetical protein